MVALSEGYTFIPFSEFTAYFQIFEPLEDVETDVKRLMLFDEIFVYQHNVKNSKSE